MVIWGERRKAKFRLYLQYTIGYDFCMICGGASNSYNRSLFEIYKCCSQAVLKWIWKLCVKVNIMVVKWEHVEKTSTSLLWLRPKEEWNCMLTLNNKKSILARGPVNQDHVFERTFRTLAFQVRTKLNILALVWTAELTHMFCKDYPDFLTSFYCYLKSSFVSLFKVSVHLQSIKNTILNIENKLLYKHMSACLGGKTKFSLNNRNRAFISRDCWLLFEPSVLNVCDPDV